jgi:diaminohydroxyphosphoribosylaminopyrimidine deaminase / 5-amino-6-(5-phosphoribosylamino)uracil reductase
VLLSRSPAPEGIEAIAGPAAIAGLADVQYLYVEGGAQTAAAFLAADLVDRLEIYRAPLVIGDGLRAVAGLSLTDLPEAQARWAPVERARLGSDSFTAYRRTR